MIFFGISGQGMKMNPKDYATINFTYPNNAAILNKIANKFLLKAVKNAT